MFDFSVSFFFMSSDRSTPAPKIIVEGEESEESEERRYGATLTILSNIIEMYNYGRNVNISELTFDGLIMKMI